MQRRPPAIDGLAASTLQLPQGAWPLIWWRGAVHVGAVLFWFYAMARIPLAHVTAIGYLNPVILVIAGTLFMGEVMTMVIIMISTCCTWVVSFVVRVISEAVLNWSNWCTEKWATRVKMLARTSRPNPVAALAEK